MAFSRSGSRGLTPINRWYGVKPSTRMEQFFTKTHSSTTSVRFAVGSSSSTRHTRIFSVCPPRSARPWHQCAPFGAASTVKPHSLALCKNSSESNAEPRSTLAVAGGPQRRYQRRPMTAQ